MVLLRSQRTVIAIEVLAHLQAQEREKMLCLISHIKTFLKSPKNAAKTSTRLLGRSVQDTIVWELRVPHQRRNNLPPQIIFDFSGFNIHSRHHLYKLTVILDADILVGAVIAGVLVGRSDTHHDEIRPGITEI